MSISIFRNKFNIGFMLLQGVDGPHPMTERRSSPISFVYIGKILFAFLLLFVIGAVFTLFLENLPQLILYINSST